MATPSSAGVVTGSGTPYDFNFSYPGLDYSSLASPTDQKALFLKVFGQEVISTFTAQATMLDKQIIKTIPFGKTAQFPTIGTADSGKFIPGNFIVGENIRQAEKTISVDFPEMASLSLADFYDMLKHFDDRSEKRIQIASALSRTYDSRGYRVIARAARERPRIVGDNRVYPGYSGANAGDWANTVGTYGAQSVPSELNNSSFRSTSAATTAATLIDLLAKAHRALTEQNVPDELFCALKPAQKYLLIYSPTTVGANTAMNRDIGGVGSVADASLQKVAGLNITAVPPTQFPSTSVTAETVANMGGNNYNGNFAKTVALVWHRGAIGTLMLNSFKAQEEYSVARQGSLFVTQYVAGHSDLRPECAVEITSHDQTANSGGSDCPNRTAAKTPAQKDPTLAADDTATFVDRV